MTEWNFKTNHKTFNAFDEYGLLGVSCYWSNTGQLTCKAEKIFSLSNLLFDLKPDSIGAELEEVLDRYQSNDQLQVAS